jgi:hypothetical protein
MDQIEIKEIDNFLPESDIEMLNSISLSITEEEWDLFNEEHLNGPFWNGKRRMIHPSITEYLSVKLSGLTDHSHSLTATNKIQRFYKDDRLGPLRDADFGKIEYACILFLNDDYEGGGIEFPDLGYTVKPSKNKLVLYKATNKYIINGPSNEAISYFITVFFDSKS